MQTNSKTGSRLAVQDFDLEDLLYREPIVLDKRKIARQLLKRTIMITGAAGSIGSELVMQIASYKPKTCF
jgi:FlaA1/EpsC-like NDP-sugar epimerase